MISSHAVYEQVYFADAHLDYVAFTDLEGHHRHVVLSGTTVPHVFALTLFDAAMPHHGDV